MEKILSSRLMLSLAAMAVMSAASGAFATTITQWSFTAAVAAPDNSPAPTTGSGTAVSLGMTNSYTYTSGPGGATLGTGAVTSDDVLSSPGVANPSFSEFTWRVRGVAGTGTTGTANNGWNLSAPQYSQGAEFDVGTAGYSNITVNFDWYSTNQGVRDLQEQYTTDGTTWNNINPLLVAVPNDYNVDSTPGNTIDLSAIAGAANNPLFGIRLVSAYDPTLSTPNTYGSANGGQSGVYNNNSGNWRFANVTFSGTAATPEPTSLMMMGLGIGALSLRRRMVKK